MIFQDPFASLNPRLKRARDRRRGAARPRPRAARRARRLPRRPPAPRRARSQPTSGAIRTSSPAGSASASASPARWRSSRSSWSATSRWRRSTSRSRRRSSISSSSCARSSASPISSSATISAWSSTSPTAILIMYLGRIVESAPTEELFAAPNHPYTQALLAEVPRLDQRKRALHAGRRARSRRPSTRPRGCHFHPRCPHAMERCRREAPALREIAPGRLSACHLNDGAAMSIDAARSPGVLFRSRSQGGEVPLVFDSPHSGTDYPEDFDHACPRHVLRTAEDTYVDELYAAAPAHGATLIGALFPRSYIDANRDVADIDQALLAEPWPAPAQSRRQDQARHGPDPPPRGAGAAGLRRKLGVAEVQARIDALLPAPTTPSSQTAADRLHARFGGVWHVNCHSMKSVSNGMASEGAGVSRAPISSSATATAPPARRNSPTSSQRFLDAARLRRPRSTIPTRASSSSAATAAPSENRHSLQIEVNRKLYMDEDASSGTPISRSSNPISTRWWRRSRGSRSERAAISLGALRRTGLPGVAAFCVQCSAPHVVIIAIDYARKLR